MLFVSLPFIILDANISLSGIREGTIEVNSVTKLKKGFMCLHTSKPNEIGTGFGAKKVFT